MVMMVIIVVNMMRDVELNDDCCAQKVQKKEKRNVKGHKKRRKYDI